MGWAEFITTNQGTRDFAGRIQRVRTFKVWSVDPSQILADPASVLNDDGQGLPGYLTSHPDGRGTLLDRYDLAAEDEIIVATAIYTNDRSGKLAPNHDRVDVSPYKYSGSATREDVRIKYVLASRKYLPALPGTEPKTTTVWEEREAHGRMRVERIQVVTNRQGFSFNDRERIGAEVGKLHNIFDPARTDSPWCLFEGADYSGLDTFNALTQITYTWRREFPIYVTDPVGQSVGRTGDVRFPEFAPLPGTAWKLGYWPDGDWTTGRGLVVRWPFEEIVWVPDKDFTFWPPTLVSTIAYATSPGGHLSLPGL